MSSSSWDQSVGGQRGMIGGMVRAKREIEIERNNARFHQIFFPGISYLKNK